MGVYTTMAIGLAFASGYVILRKGRLWISFALFGVVAILLLSVRNPNYQGTAKLLAVQSLMQMLWTVVFTFGTATSDRHPSG